ncbi:Kelch repeat-containing protein [Tautonia rosea]|uniref:Kelch repeat-containing protein n=1 Tax=Tautonia rosea TaxID=2728037 RepID=UPI001474F98C|nr:kelch repeat-containing protein [Tautonia rosea]
MKRSAPRCVRLRGLCAAVASLSLFGLGQPSSAHFLWISGEREEDGSVVAHAFFADQTVPDLPMFLKYLDSATYSIEGKPLSLNRGEDSDFVQLPENLPRVVDGELEFGIMNRGESTFRLMYTTRLQLGPLPTGTVEAGEGLRMSWLVDAEEPALIQVRFNGEPAARAEVKVYHEDGNDRTLIADDQGRVRCPDLADGRAGLLAKWIDGTAGELDGTPYPESRHYATLMVTPILVSQDTKAVADTCRLSRPFALIPEPINSFGGAVVGDSLYVYSGHTGTTHRYHTGTTNPHFYRLDLRDRTTWEELPCGTALQGVALVAHDGKLIRVGGMLARNEEGSPHDLISVDEVARFDPETSEWTDLPPLPEPRSTHDAAVLGDYLYVVGGWSMTGGDSNGAYFLDDALRLDLTNPEAGWEVLPSLPTPRRALAVAAHDGKIFVVGGLLENGDTTREVVVFDPEDQSWMQGPELPGEPIQGFAPSAFSLGGRLLASGGNGTVYRLTETADSWEAIAEQAVPRITHRLLPGIDEDALIVGGNFAGVPVRFIESIPLDGTTSAMDLVTWTVELPGAAVQSHAVSMVGSQVLLAGGNRSANPHDFKSELLTDEVFTIRLDGTRAEPIGALPSARQSSVVVSVPDGRQLDTYVLGGIADDGEVVRTLGSVVRRQASESTWESLKASIPDDRGMFGAAVHDGAIWVFGGSIFDPRPEAQNRGFPTEVLRWDVEAEDSTFEVTEHQIPRARRSFAGAVLDGNYYLVGGLGDDQTLVDVVDVFNFETKAWQTIPSPSQPRVFADLVVLDGKLYMGGGFAAGSSGHFEPARSIEVYDPESGTWSTMIEELPIAVNALRLMTVRDRLLLFGIDANDPQQARFVLMAPQPFEQTTLKASASANTPVGLPSLDQAQDDSTR